MPGKYKSKDNSVFFPEKILLVKEEIMGIFILRLQNTFSKRAN
jgi:hypothetical protein